MTINSFIIIQPLCYYNLKPNDANDGLENLNKQNIKKKKRITPR